MTFGGTFLKINLDSSIIDVILLTNLIFLALNSGSHMFSYIFISFNSALFNVSFSISFLAMNKPYPNISDEDVGKTGHKKTNRVQMK
jgi:hypothetical protein